MPSTTPDLTATRLNPSDLKELAETTGHPCVSIVMQTHRAGPETLQSPTQFKNLLGRAQQKLDDAGHDCAILGPLEPLLSNSDFWQHQSEGLAVFLAPELCRLIKLDRSVTDHVYVDDDFWLLPLVRRHHAADHSLVLTLTWDEAKLFRCDGESLELWRTKSLPAKFHDLVLPRDPEETLQNTSHRSVGNTIGTSTAMFHGQGEGEDKIAADRRQYLSLVGDEVAAVIYDTGLPLVIVATAEVAGHFQAATDVSVDAKVGGSPAQWSDAELRKRVLDVLADSTPARAAEFVQRFGTAASQGQGSNDIADVLAAAKQGRVELVMISENENDTALVNAIVIQTLLHGGEVFRGEAEHLPADSDIAAIFRY